MKKLILLIMFLTAVTLLQAESVTDQATAAYRMGNFQKAADLYELALVQESDNTLIHRMLGSALYKLGRPQEAIEHFEIYLAGNPDPRLQAYVDNAKSQMQAIQQINSTPVTSGSVVPGISKKKGCGLVVDSGHGSNQAWRQDQRVDLHAGHGCTCRWCALCKWGRRQRLRCLQEIHHIRRSTKQVGRYEKLGRHVCHAGQCCHCTVCRKHCGCLLFYAGTSG